MILQIHTPPYPLRTFVKSFIYYKGYTSESAYEKLFPDGNTQLIIELDGKKRILKDELNDCSFQTAWITGVQTQPIVYQSEKNATTLCIQFEVGGLSSLTGIPAIEFKDTLVDALLVMGNPIIELRERIIDCAKAATIFHLATEFLEKQFIKNSLMNHFMAFMHNALCSENNSLASISNKAGYSQKHLITLFKQWAGLSPKKYQRVYRFNKALELLQIKEKPNFIDVALSSNYYDQAHFINEFRYFTNYSPTQYLNFHKTYPHVIPLDTLR